ncbi:Glycosyltransferase 2-like [Acididesulfobacillus acetoxydans]|uniref:Glycosyl transferase 2 n=1 Tax=Acididesulfobacillus acetoxydans TaxID=1561005 RepID=A0A8S0WEP3_9FIRM|nr:TPR domain-containing glycosyltransferase [Acididesulfobacillus acetoxydans]CAA7600322.1 Glycosyltransferase 2-like [Acididesulfobacillus acetoxydans]CEJ06098.1 Glycosyl transferase 2 [Acididesulfobacillus acetoxydans]
MTQNHKISLIMIVKNEESHLAACLESAKDCVDEIVIVDTGSADATLTIARSYTDRIYFYPWNEDFSAARNFALDRADGDWILSLDADEELVFPGGDPGEALHNLAARDERVEAYLLPLENSTSAYEINRFHVLRFFRHHARYRYIGKIHEQITVSAPGVTGISTAPVISHKLLSGRDRNRKRGRNLLILQNSLRQEPDNYFLHYYLGVEWLMLAQPQRALPFLQGAYEHLSDDHLLFRAPAFRYLILALQALGRLDEGICLCQEAARRYPEFTDVFYLGGILLEEKQYYVPAAAWFTAALECGEPPALFSHLKGAGSFLARYHLGHCQTLVGQESDALRSYEQALRDNPRYHYPIYALVQLLIKADGAASALSQLLERKLLLIAHPESGRINPALPLAAADCFFVSGHPDLALLCLVEGFPHPSQPESSPEATSVAPGPEVLFCQARYTLFSGNVRSGLESLEALDTNNPYAAQIRIYRTIAHLLLGQFPPAKAQTSALWRDPATRPQAYLLHLILQLMEKGFAGQDTLFNLPGAKIRGVDLWPLCLNLLNEAGCFLPVPAETTLISRYVRSLEHLAGNLTPGGYPKLRQFYRHKAETIKNGCETRFGKVESR